MAFLPAMLLSLLPLADPAKPAPPIVINGVTVVEHRFGEFDLGDHIR